ncbi:hypothetical protein ACH4EC_37555 [Streptomyces anulatus]
MLLGLAPVPHLWNTVTLAGDVRHRNAADQDTVNRQQREEQTLAAKYAPGPIPAGGLLTDADPQVSSLALTMIRALLADGTLTVRELPVRLCARCGHMAGTGTAGDCRSCGHGGSRVARRPLLVFDRTAHGPARPSNGTTSTPPAPAPRCTCSASPTTLPGCSCSPGLGTMGWIWRRSGWTAWCWTRGPGCTSRCWPPPASRAPCGR